MSRLRRRIESYELEAGHDQSVTGLVFLPHSLNNPIITASPIIPSPQSSMPVASSSHAQPSHSSALTAIQTSQQPQSSSQYQRVPNTVVISGSPRGSLLPSSISLSNNFTAGPLPQILQSGPMSQSQHQLLHQHYSSGHLGMAANSSNNVKTSASVSSTTVPTIVSSTTSHVAQQSQFPLVAFPLLGASSSGTGGGSGAISGMEPKGSSSSMQVVNSSHQRLAHHHSQPFVLPSSASSPLTTTHVSALADISSKLNSMDALVASMPSSPHVHGHPFVHPMETTNSNSAMAVGGGAVSRAESPAGHQSGGGALPAPIYDVANMPLPSLQSLPIGHYHSNNLSSSQQKSNSPSTPQATSEGHSLGSVPPSSYSFKIRRPSGRTSGIQTQQSRPELVDLKAMLRSSSPQQASIGGALMGGSASANNLPNTFNSLNANNHSPNYSGGFGVPHTSGPPSSEGHEAQMVMSASHTRALPMTSGSGLGESRAAVASGAAEGFSVGSILQPMDSLGGGGGSSQRLQGANASGSTPSRELSALQQIHSSSSQGHLASNAHRHSANSMNQANMVMQHQASGYVTDSSAQITFEQVSHTESGQTTSASIVQTLSVGGMGEAGSVARAGSAQSQGAASWGGGVIGGAWARLDVLGAATDVASSSKRHPSPTSPFGAYHRAGGVIPMSPTNAQGAGFLIGRQHASGRNVVGSLPADTPAPALSVSTGGRGDSAFKVPALPTVLGTSTSGGILITSGAHNITLNSIPQHTNSSASPSNQNISASHNNNSNSGNGLLASVGVSGNNTNTNTNTNTTGTSATSGTPSLFPSAPLSAPLPPFSTLPGNNTSTDGPPLYSNGAHQMQHATYHLPALRPGLTGGASSPTFGGAPNAIGAGGASFMSFGTGQGANSQHTAVTATASDGSNQIVTVHVLGHSHPSAVMSVNNAASFTTSTFTRQKLASGGVTGYVRMYLPGRARTASPSAMSRHNSSYRNNGYANNNNTSTSSRGIGGGGGLTPPRTPPKTPPRSPPRSPSRRNEERQFEHLQQQLHLQQMQERGGTPSPRSMVGGGGGSAPPIYFWKVMARADDVIMKCLPGYQDNSHPEVSMYASSVGGTVLGEARGLGQVSLSSMSAILPSLAGSQPPPSGAQGPPVMLPLYPYGVEALGGIIDPSFDMNSNMSRPASFSRTGARASVGNSSSVGSLARQRSLGLGAFAGQNVLTENNNSSTPSTPPLGPQAHLNSVVANHAGRNLVYSLRYVDIKAVGRIRRGGTQPNAAAPSTPTNTDGRATPTTHVIPRSPSVASSSPVASTSLMTTFLPPSIAGANNSRSSISNLQHHASTSNANNIINASPLPYPHGPHPHADILQLVLVSGHEIHLEIPPNCKEASDLAEALLDGRNQSILQRGGIGGGNFIPASRLGSDAPSSSFGGGGIGGISFYQQQQQQQQQAQAYPSSHMHLNSSGRARSASAENQMGGLGMQSVIHPFQQAHLGALQNNTGLPGNHSSTSGSSRGANTNSQAPNGLSPVLLAAHLNASQGEPPMLTLPSHALGSHGGQPSQPILTSLLHRPQVGHMLPPLAKSPSASLPPFGPSSPIRASESELGDQATERGASTKTATNRDADSLKMASSNSQHNLKNSTHTNKASQSDGSVSGPNQNASINSASPSTRTTNNTVPPSSLQPNGSSKSVKGHGHHRPPPLFGSFNETSPTNLNRLAPLRAVPMSLADPNTAGASKAYGSGNDNDTATQLAASYSAGRKDRREVDSQKQMASSVGFRPKPLLPIMSPSPARPVNAFVTPPSNGFAPPPPTATGIGAFGVLGGSGLDDDGSLKATLSNQRGTHGSPSQPLDESRGRSSPARQTSIQFINQDQTSVGHLRAVPVRTRGTGSVDSGSPSLPISSGGVTAKSRRSTTSINTSQEGAGNDETNLSPTFETTNTDGTTGTIDTNFTTGATIGTDGSMVVRVSSPSGKAGKPSYSVAVPSSPTGRPPQPLQGHGKGFVHQLHQQRALSQPQQLPPPINSSPIRASKALQMLPSSPTGRMVGAGSFMSLKSEVFDSRVFATEGDRSVKSARDASPELGLGMDNESGVDEYRSSLRNVTHQRETTDGSDGLPLGRGDDVRPPIVSTSSMELPSTLDDYGMNGLAKPQGRGSSRNASPNLIPANAEEVSVSTVTTVTTSGGEKNGSGSTPTAASSMIAPSSTDHKRSSATITSVQTGSKQGTNTLSNNAYSSSLWGPPSHSGGSAGGDSAKAGGFQRASMVPNLSPTALSSHESRPNSAIPPHSSTGSSSNKGSNIGGRHRSGAHHGSQNDHHSHSSGSMVAVVGSMRFADTANTNATAASPANPVQESSPTPTTIVRRIQIPSRQQEKQSQAAVPHQVNEDDIPLVRMLGTSSVTDSGVNQWASFGGGTDGATLFGSGIRRVSSVWVSDSNADEDKTPR